MTATDRQRLEREIAYCKQKIEDLRLEPVASDVNIAIGLTQNRLERARRGLAQLTEEAV